MESDLKKLINITLLYVIILIVSFYFFSYKTITLSIIFSVFIGLFIILRIFSKECIHYGTHLELGGL